MGRTHSPGRTPYTRAPSNVHTARFARHHPHIRRQIKKPYTYITMQQRLTLHQRCAIAALVVLGLLQRVRCDSLGRHRDRRYARSTTNCYPDSANVFPDPTCDYQGYLARLAPDCTVDWSADTNGAGDRCRCPERNDNADDFRNQKCSLENRGVSTGQAPGYASSYCSKLIEYYSAATPPVFLGSECQEQVRISDAWLTRASRPLQVARPWVGCWDEGYQSSCSCNKRKWGFCYSYSCVCKDTKKLLGEGCHDGWGSGGECHQDGAAPYSDNRLSCWDYGDGDGARCRPAFQLYGGTKTCECGYDWNVAGFICGADDNACHGHACVWGTNGVNKCDLQGTGNDW